MIRLTTLTAAAALLAACSQPAEAPSEETQAPDPAPAAEDAPAPAPAPEDAQTSTAEDRLEAVLAHERRDEDRARDEFRNPGETLAFFGVEPGMTVAEALPGGGWYTRVVLPYVGEDGAYIALNYPKEVWRLLYGENWSEETSAEIDAWTETAPADLVEFGPDSARIDAYMLDAIPDAADGQADVVLFVRAMHHLFRFDAPALETVLAETYDLVKPGGVVGVVQHRAKADAPADYVTGDNGYLKEADVIAAFEATGFELEASSEINANPRDTADYENGVWTLPPTGGGGEEYADIGESDRMTLKFVKPE